MTAVTDNIRQAARLIYDARRNRTTIARLPEELRPSDPEAALAIQNEVTRLIGQPIAGWKCGLPKPGRIGVAPIFHIYRQSPVPVNSRGGPVLAEPEIAFILKRDLPPRDSPYTDAEIHAAIGEARLAIEILGPRFSDFEDTEFVEKMADHVLNESLFVGPPMTAPIDESLAAFPVTIERAGESLLKRDGKHPDGGPFAPFAFLANFLAGRGGGLKAGEVVTTGSYIGYAWVPAEGPLRFTYGGIGRLEIEFQSLAI